MEAVELEHTAPVQLAAGLADGKPPHLHEKAAMSYWVWQGNQNEWYLRSTTSKEKHRFQGRLRPLHGASLTNLKASRLEHGDRMRMHGQDIVFDFVTGGGEDGFDFGVVGNGCIEMDLRIDGAPHPKLIHVGKGEHSPDNAHFIACP